MAGISQNTLAQGFSVSQPTFDSPLQFYPVLGSQELDDLINAYVPGASPISEKRAVVSMDFFNYSHATGETFRYYPVTSASPVQDSGYASSFVSPAMSNWSWSQSTSASASASTPPSAIHDASISRSKAKKSSASASRASDVDFSNLPGMKIMTRDGRDVTNSASRGCKSKEQRDHAHLMRIIKACDSCKKKKIRCDPSHKNRSSGAPAAAQSQASSRSKMSTRQTKQPVREARIAVPSEYALVSEPSLFMESAFADVNVPDLDMSLQDAWDAFVNVEEQPLDLMSAGYDFFFDPANHFSPASSLSASPGGIQNETTSTQPSGSQGESLGGSQAAASHRPALPYQSAGVSGTDYVDFNLFSPASSFVDEDSMPMNDIGDSTTAVQYLDPGDLVVQRAGSGSGHDPIISGPQSSDTPSTLEAMVDHGLLYWAHAEATSSVLSTIQDGRPSPSIEPRAPGLLLSQELSVQRPAVRDVTSHVTSSPEINEYAAQSGLNGLGTRSTGSNVSAVKAGAVLHASAQHPTDTQQPGDYSSTGDKTDKSSGIESRLPAVTALASSSAPLSSRCVSTTTLQTRLSSSDPTMSTPRAIIRRGEGCDLIPVRSEASSNVSVHRLKAIEEASEHGIFATVALGLQDPQALSASLALLLLATSFGLPSVVSLIQLGLGLVVLASVSYPRFVSKSLTEQRIHKITSIHQSQKGKQDLLSPISTTGRTWSTALQVCRQMKNAHDVKLMGNLATSGLLALH